MRKGLIDVPNDKVKAVLENIGTDFAKADDYRPMLNGKEDMIEAMNIAGGKAAVEDYQARMMALLMFNQTSMKHSVSSMFEDYCRVFNETADERVKRAFFAGVLADKGHNTLKEHAESDDLEELTAEKLKELGEKNPQALVEKLLQAVKNGKGAIVQVETKVETKKKKGEEDDEDDERQSYIG